MMAENWWNKQKTSEISFDQLINRKLQMINFSINFNQHILPENVGK